eukprot:NODE_76_length_23837_cov_1.242396.p17 type:complete len:142 gc:universal NODE_76_length_23837_cov_1.242396:21947-22372(+)
MILLAVIITAQFCPDVFDPVCVDGTTFSNSCKAQVAGFNVTTKGACNDVFVLPPSIPDNLPSLNSTNNQSSNNTLNASLNTNCSYNPVCYNGTTYESECLAKEKNITDYVDGNCANKRDSSNFANTVFVGLLSASTLFNLL